MKMKRWQLWTILGLVTINSIFSYRIAHETCEFAQYLEHLSGTPNVSQEYAYVKDFMDRNIEVFTLTTALFVTAITFIIGFGFKFDFDRRIADVEKRFVTFTTTQKSVDDDRIRDHNKLRLDSQYENGNLFNTISDTTIFQDVKINCRLWAVVYWLRSAKDAEGNVSHILERAKGALENLLGSITDNLQETQFHKNSSETVAALIDSAPKQMMPLVGQVSSLYLAEVERIRKL